MTQTKTRFREKNLKNLRLPPDRPQVTYWDDQMAGFGLVVGKKRRTFVFRARVEGRQRKVAIGVHGSAREADHDCPPVCKSAGCMWTLKLAKHRATELKNAMAKGIDPTAIRKARQRSMTLGRALEIHIENRKAAGGRPSAYWTTSTEVEKHLKSWLETPLVEITRQHCRDRHLEIRDESGPHLADRVMRHFRALWNTALISAEESDPLLRAGAVPTVAVAWCARKKGPVKRRRKEPISWADVPAWFKKVSASGSVGDACLLLVFFTGLRKMDAATVRWEQIDFAVRTLDRPSPKGGEAHAFKIPLSSEVIKLLEKRKEQNAVDFGDDHGWCFPVYADKSDADKKEQNRCYHCPDLGLPPHKAGTVTHISSPRTQTYVKGKKVRDSVSAHRLRDTFMAACNEVEGLSVYDIKALVNHAQPSGDVTADYIKLEDEHLARIQEKVTKHLLKKAGK